MRRSLELELMDVPGQAAEVLEEDLGNLRTINRYLGGYRSVFTGLKRLVDSDRIESFSLLDVGTGSGDIPAAIARWAARRGIRAKLFALERDPVTVRIAAKLNRPTNFDVGRAGACAPHGFRAGNQDDAVSVQRGGISILRADATAAPFRARSFDFILASQLLHHFDETTIVAALKTWSKLARKAIIISDLLRDPLAYHGIRLLTKLFTRNVMTRTDAPLSVHRAFTIREWRDLIHRAELGPARVYPVFPFRVVALIPVSR